MERAEGREIVHHQQIGPWRDGYIREDELIERLALGNL